MVETPELKSDAGIGPINAGIRAFFLDSGITSAFTIVVGIVFLVAGATVNQILDSRVIDIVGLFISAYAAFLLYRNYSRENKALITLMVTAIVFSAIDFGSQAAFHQTLQPVYQALGLVTDLAAYFFGWYLAATTNFKIFLLGRKWVTAFFIFGIIMFVLGEISLGAGSH